MGGRAGPNRIAAVGPPPYGPFGQNPIQATVENALIFTKHTGHEKYTFYGIQSDFFDR